MRIILLALALVLVACGVKKETHRKALDQIKLLEGQVSDANREADDRARRIAVLEADLTAARRGEKPRAGQTLLALPAATLFKGGSAELSDAGKATLARVAAALITFKERRFLIAGPSPALAAAVVAHVIAAGFPAANLGAAGDADDDIAIILLRDPPESR